MTDITRHPDLRWIGALQVHEDVDGLRPTRIPPADGYQMQLITEFSATACSGVRVSFRTDSTSLAFTCSPLRITWPGYDPAAVFDVRVNGDLAERVETRAGTVGQVVDLDMTIEWTDNGTESLRIDGLAPEMKTVELWMPHGAGVRLHSITVDEGSAIEPTESAPVWIHHGSSISQCGEAAGPSEIWAAVAARLGDYEIVSLGFGGECHVDQFMARYMRDAEAALISLKFGINSFTTLTERTFPSAVHGFLDTVRDGHPNTPIVLCSPIYCPLAEDRVGPLGHDGTGFFVPEPPPHPVPGLLTLQRTRELLADIVRVRRERGDANLMYLSGLELFDEPDAAAGDLPDDLHPNAAGYIRMGERFADRVFGTTGLLATRSTP